MMAKKIKEEDEAEMKANKAAMAEKEKKAHNNQDYSISTSKLEEAALEAEQPKEERVVVKKNPEPKKVEKKEAKVEKKEDKPAQKDTK